ncbi:NPHS1 nephrin S homeolog precursor [Xenopus laevis]|uniref:Nephrin n=1 Tax=Xenopus laevis TaxID=8355 RepID=Q58QC3_XENLA|nr:NPHS1 nephrin S homeolog precursor [Xenopus laevis]AAX35539.1 nephrin [Xenopus laevis]
MVPVLFVAACCSWWMFREGVSAVQQVFRVQPDNITIVKGSTALLSCEVEHGTGMVQWEKNGLLLGPDRNIPGFPRYSMTGDPHKGEYNLRIERIELDDDAEYHCQVGRSEVSLGIISLTALINVLIPPKAPTFEEHAVGSRVTWVYGVEYTVTCQATDAKPAAVLTIKKSDLEVSGDSSTSPGSRDRLENTALVTKVIPQSSDNGKLLTCLALNPALQTPITVSFTMNVLFPPNAPIIEGYTGPSVKAGETLKLICISLSGNPLATLQWSKNDDVVSTRWETDEVVRSSRSHLTLSIKPADNMAVVSCEAVNHVTPQTLKTSIILNVVFLPTEVTILGSPSGPEKSSLSFSCFTAASNPPVQIRWWLGPKELVNTIVTITDAAHGGKVTMSNLTMVALREEHGMSLTCEAFNEVILYTKSNSVTLSVQYPPQNVWIEAPPTDKFFRAGTAVKMTCFSSGGNPPPRLTWIKDTKSLSGGTQIHSGKIVTKEITIITVPSDNLATYRCNASNIGKTALTASTKLKVQFPAIDVNIMSSAKEYRRGSTITLTCVTGSSNPASTISWVKNGEQLKAQDLGRKPSLYGGISSSSRVTLIATSKDNGRRVSCEAFSSVLNEAVNTFYKLNILFPPEFLDDQPTVVQAVEHGAALIPVRVRANPPQINYTWSLWGEKLIRDGAYRHHLRGEGALEIWNVSRADSGIYNVTCVNKEGKNSVVIRLDVQYSPTIRSLGDTEVDLGADAEIVCTADANPVTDSMFQWRWLGDEERDLSALERRVDGVTGRLVIREAKRTDAGRYECAVDNGIPPSVKADARLIVRFKPDIHKGVHLSKVAVPGDGKSVAALVCKAEGIPSVAFSWAKNGVSLDLKGPRYSEKTFHELSVHTSTLVISNVSAVKDYALFTCTAMNTLGVDSFSIQLVSTSRPDPPSGLKVIGFTHNSVTLQWSSGFDGGAEQKFRVRYRWPETDSHMYVDVFPPQDTVFTITGLKGSTAYNFSVNAINALGESDYADQGAVVSVTTKETTLLLVPTQQPTRVPVAESLEWPPYILAAVCAGGALLLISNAAFIGCLVKRSRDKSQGGEGEKKDESGQERTLNEYGDGELINTHAKKTLLIDSGSETGSSLYQDSTSESGIYYYPVRDYRPSLFPHYEVPERGEPGIQGWEEGGYEDWYATSEGHEYAEVGEDYPQSSRVRWHNREMANQGRETSWAEYQDPGRLRIYDEADAPLSDIYETPYGGRGQLV